MRAVVNEDFELPPIAKSIIAVNFTPCGLLSGGCFFPLPRAWAFCRVVGAMVLIYGSLLLALNKWVLLLLLLLSTVNNVVEYCVVCSFGFACFLRGGVSLGGILGQRSAGWARFGPVVLRAGAGRPN